MSRDPKSPSANLNDAICSSKGHFKSLIADETAQKQIKLYEQHYGSPSTIRCQHTTFNTLRPDKMAAILQTTFSKAFPWMKMYEFQLKNSLKFVLKGPINNIPALVQIMACRHPGDKPLSGTIMIILLTHIYVTRPQCVKCWCCVYTGPDIDHYCACRCPSTWQCWAISSLNNH